MGIFLLTDIPGFVFAVYIGCAFQDFGFWKPLFYVTGNEGEQGCYPLPEATGLPEIP